MNESCIYVEDLHDPIPKFLSNKEANSLGTSEYFRHSYHPKLPESGRYKTSTSASGCIHEFSCYGV